MGFKDLTLNAGCGANTWGDLRVDIQTFSDVYYRKKTSVNIVASIEYLPFRDKIFNITRCHHVLEHVKRPFNCVDELKRVTKGWLLIHVPVHHLYCFIIDAVSLLKYFMMIPFIGISAFKDHLYKVRSWKLRYSGHKWYIKGRKINRAYWILPLEYEVTYYLADKWLNPNISNNLPANTTGIIVHTEEEFFKALETIEKNKRIIFDDKGTK